MVNDDNPNPESQGEPEDVLNRDGQPAGGEPPAAQQPGLQLPRAPLVEAADFLGLDSEVAAPGGRAPGQPGQAGLPQGSASSWLFQDDPVRDEALQTGESDESTSAAQAPGLPTGSIQGSWLLNSDFEGAAAPVAPRAQQPPLEPAPPPAHAQVANAAQAPAASSSEPVEGTLAGDPDAEHWLLDLDVSQDDGTRPVGQLDDIEAPRIAGLGASYHEPLPTAESVKSMAPRLILATCVGVLAVAALKFTRGFERGEFVPLQDTPLVVSPPLQVETAELEALSPRDRAALHSGAGREGLDAGAHDFRESLDPARQTLSRMREPWIRQGGRAHKEPGELESFPSEDYPVAGAASVATIYIFPPPAGVSESRRVLEQLNELTRGGEPAVSGEELRLALLEFPGSEGETLAASTELEPRGELAAAGTDAPLGARIGPQWGEYLAQMQSELERRGQSPAGWPAASLERAPESARVALFGERPEDPDAAFLALGFRSARSVSDDERGAGRQQASDDSWYLDHGGPADPLPGESFDSLAAGPGPLQSEPLLALLAFDHGFDAPFVEGWSGLEFERAALRSGAGGETSAFPPRAYDSASAELHAAVVVPGEGGPRTPFGADQVGPPRVPLAGRGALLARLLPPERDPLDLYYDWRRGEQAQDPLFEYVVALGYASAQPPSAEAPFIGATVEEAETYLSSLGPYPPAARITLPSTLEPALQPELVASVEPTPMAAEPPLPKGIFGMPKLSPSTLVRADARDRWMQESIPRHAISASAPLKTPLVGRVRAVFDSGEVLIGRLWAVGQDRIWVETSLGRLTLESRHIVKLERMDGKGTGEIAGDNSLAGLPRVRVWVAGGVIVGHQVSRVGDEVVLLTDGGRLKLKSDRIESANTRRTTVMRSSN